MYARNSGKVPHVLKRCCPLSWRVLKAWCTQHEKSAAVVDSVDALRAYIASLQQPPVYLGIDL